MKIRLTICLTLLALRVFADADGDFAAANRLYQQGKFSDAAAGYEKILAASPGSAAVWFNLGNAELKARQVGRAIAAYRRAENLLPRDADLRANLRFARAQVSEGATLRPDFLHRALARLTLNEWTVLAGFAVAALFVMLALREWRAEWRDALRRWISLTGAAGAGLAVCTFAAWSLNCSTPVAVVVANEAVVRAGPLEDAQNVFTLKDGVELAVTDQKDDWLEISDGQNRVGWLKRDSVALLAP